MQMITLFSKNDNDEILLIKVLQIKRKIKLKFTLI